MENNLEDVLVDNFEDKNPKKSNKRIILIVIASVVLLGVLGVSSLMLAKQEPAPKNLEFDELEIELEKLSPPTEESEQSKQEDKFDKLIAEIKNRQSDIDSHPKITPLHEEKTDSKDQKKLTQQVQPHLDQTIKPTNQPETTNAKIDLQFEDSSTSKQKDEQKKTSSNNHSGVTSSTTKNSKTMTATNDQKIQRTHKASNQSSNKSAVQLFQSVEKSIPKGFYLQVGVFSNKPQPSFIEKIRAYPYKTKQIQRNGRILTQYLIGPFPKKEDAQLKTKEITQKITKPVVVEIK